MPGKILKKTFVICVVIAGWWRVIGCLIFIGHFLQKSPMNSGSFAESDLQLKASYGSSPPCNRRAHLAAHINESCHITHVILRT